MERYFEQVRGFFEQAVGFGMQGGPKVQIVVFRSDKEYAPYAPNEFAAAFYLGTEDRDYIVMKSAATEHFPMAVHEYAHLLIKHTRITVPVWFNEGLAEFYSNLRPMGGKVVVGAAIAGHYALLQHAKWIDLATLLAVQHDSPLYNEKSRAGILYAESWALVHMLYLGKDYRGNLHTLLEGIKAGTPMADVFMKAYHKSIPEVQKDLQVYMTKTSFDASIFDIKLADKVERPEIEESSALEVGLVMADLEANTRGKAEEARALFTRLAKENPKDWRVEAGLAQVCRHETKNEEALTHFARAAELGSNSARMFLEYGRILRVYDKQQEAVKALKQAVTLDPGSREAHLELGYTYLVANEPGAALAELTSVKRVTPDQAFPFFHAMAYAYYRLDKTDEAKAAAEKARTYAGTPDEKRRLDQLVEALGYQSKLAEQATEAKAREPKFTEAETAQQVLQVRPPLASAEGTLQQIECAGSKFRMRIATGGKTAWYSLDPQHVMIKNGGSMDFTCGPQKGQRIRVEYDKPDLIRTIEFP